MRIVNHDIRTWISRELEKAGFTNAMENAWTNGKWTAIVGKRYLYADFQDGSAHVSARFVLDRSNGGLHQFLAERTLSHRQVLTVGRSVGPTIPRLFHRSLLAKMLKVKS